jgi:hypothetical protein
MGIGGLPPGTFTYTLVAQGDGGPLTRTATIVVNSVDGLGASLTIVPPVIASNQSATMSWTITGANFRWVHGWQPGYNGVSIYPAPATGSTTLSGLSPGTYSYTIEYGPDLYYGSRQTFAYLTVLGVNRTVSTSVAPAGTGTVTGAGTYPEGASATLAATPGPAHVFSHWSGDLAGTANPLTFTIGAQNYAVTANFAPANYTLITAASGGGSVTPGGTYPAGSSVTISADGGGIARFTGWTGDASGSSNPLLVTMNADKAITGLFTPKLAQTIAFSPPAIVRLDAAGSVVIPLTATASSGLPVSLALLSGPANLAGTTLAITGAGAVVVQAAQGGDATFLPAPTVTRTINGSAAGGLLQEPPGDKVHATDLPGNATLIRTR